MKKIIFPILTLALAASVSASAQSLDRSVRPKAGPAPEIKLGKTEEFTLPNGLRVFVVENHKLPVISCDIQLDIKPALAGNEAGYKDMLSELLTSGTKTRSKDQLNKEIDFIGASINASDDEIAGSGLKKHADKILELMSDIAINANFKQEELDKIKKRTLSGLETEENDPDAMGRNVSAAVNFGPAHPYGEVPNKKTVSNVTLKTCDFYYHTYFRPNVAYMAIVGDVTVDEVKPMIEKYFGSWQKAEVPTTSYSRYPLPTTTKVVFVPRVGAVQSVVNVTYPIDLKPGNEDVIKARVLNTILGGGSQGRLFLDLREKHGWTYGSYSSIKDDQFDGTFTAYVKCRNNVSDSAVAAILDEMNRLRNEKVAAEDLQNSITYMSGGFAIALEDPARVAQYAINIERYHMPKNYYKDYLKTLSAVNADDIQNMARKYILPDNANVVVVGSKDEVAKTLTKFAKDGTISYYNSYGESIKPVEMSAAPTNITADEVMKKYINAIGGAKAINGIKDIKTVMAAQAQGMQLTITEMKKAPGMFVEEVAGNMNGQKMVFQKQAFNGTKGYQEQQGQKQDMDANDLEETKAEADIYIDLHPEKYGIKRTVKGVEAVNGSDAYVVEAVNAKGKKTTEYYDKASGLLVKKVQSQETPQGAISQTSEYSDYKEVPGGNGYKIYYKVKESVGPQVIAAEVQSVEVNKGIPDSEFN
ncbi:MAG: insulinase family protein [Bacteroidetes bacterium]|nr:insulinase family protein [Bacteroidota bacterium]